MNAVSLPSPAAASRLALGAALLLAAAPIGATLGAQRVASRPALLEVTPYAGLMRFGDLANGPLGTSVRSKVAPLAGAQVGIALTPNVAVVGNVAYSRGDLEVGLPLLGGFDVGSSSSWLYDGALELRLPLGAGIAPFVQVGGGAVTTKLSSGPVSTSNTNPALVAGGGLDVPLGRTLGLRFYVRDHVARNEAGAAGDLDLKGDVAHNVSGGFGLRLSF